MSDRGARPSCSRGRKLTAKQNIQLQAHAPRYASYLAQMPLLLLNSALQESVCAILLLNLWQQ